ncbi:MAG: DUF1801 domain-containing protein [Acidimicrobiia bacterium]
MADNKTKPTEKSVKKFLSTVNENRVKEAQVLIEIMQSISGNKATMWGESIIGFGSTHYKYETGREGDMPTIGFSPRKAKITIYFTEGFDHHSSDLLKLGKYKSSVSCLYINKLQDVDIKTLTRMLEKSYKINTENKTKPETVKEYIEQIPSNSKKQFLELRKIVKQTLPKANEVLSYGIVGYKIDNKRARVYIAGWKDHLSMYPIPKDEKLVSQLKPYIKGKGTLWFSLDEALPKTLITKTIKALCA